MWPKRYAKDMERAWNRVRAVPSVHIETPFGGLEYAQRGTGAPILMSHGIWGSHAEGIGMVPTYIGVGYSSVDDRVSATSAQPYHGTLRLPTRPTRIYTCSIIFRSTVRLPLDTPPEAPPLSSLRYAIPIGSTR